MNISEFWELCCYSSHCYLQMLFKQS